jgi:hypothetical protein
MKHLLFQTMIGLAVAGILPTLAAAKAPIAAALLSAKEAAALVGGPLEEVTKSETKPDAQNGRDHNTICGYFPKGYKIAEAERPPERGVEVSLHTFPSPAEAKRFFGFTREAEQEAAKTIPGAKLVPLKGAGEAGVLSTKTLRPEPDAHYQIGIASFIKGATMAQVTVWKRKAPVDAIAAAAAKQIAAKLP